MKNLLNNIKGRVLLAGVFSLLIMSSCKKNDDTIVTGTATIKVVNAFEGSNPQDFYQGSSKLSTSAVAYGSTSGNLTAQAGTTNNLAFTNNGSTTVTAGTTVNLTVNANYTVFYNKKADGSAEVVGYQDDNTAAASGKARVRFINLGSGLSSTVDILANGGASLISALALRTPSTYQSIDPGVDFSARVTGSLTATTILGSEFQAGKIYTVWFDSATATTVKYHVVVQN